MISQTHPIEGAHSQGKLGRHSNEAARPEWIPTSGIRTAQPGLYFDVVRIPGERGSETAATLCEEAGGDVGPILRVVEGPDVTFLFVAPGKTGYRWPPGIRELERHETIRIPPYDGDEYLVWVSHATVKHPFVSRDTIRAHLTTVTGWAPLEES